MRMRCISALSNTLFCWLKCHPARACRADCHHQSRLRRLAPGLRQRATDGSAAGSPDFQGAHSRIHRRIVQISPTVATGSSGPLSAGAACGLVDNSPLRSELPTMPTGGFGYDCCCNYYRGGPGSVERRCWPFQLKNAGLFNY